MRLRLWTPAAGGWLREVAGQLAREEELTLVTAETGAVAAADLPDLDVFHVADDSAHGFVYRALIETPGLVILEDWRLARLVRCETAGRGAPEVYRSEARRAHGPKGAFVAEQVLRGLGGELVSLLTLNDRVLEACLGLVVTAASTFEQARPRLAGRPLLRVDTSDAAAAAAGILALARELAPRAAGARSGFAARRAEEASPLGRVLVELRPFARALGLDELPSDVKARLAALVQRSGAAGAEPT